MPQVNLLLTYYTETESILENAAITISPGNRMVNGRVESWGADTTSKGLIMAEAALNTWVLTADIEDKLSMSAFSLKSRKIIYLVSICQRQVLSFHQYSNIVEVLAQSMLKRETP
jgi:hypothetical protein